MKQRFEKEDWIDTQRGSSTQAIPVNKEFQRHLSLYYKQNPHLVMSETRKIMKEHGGICLFTPPFVPECQPIEMFWGVVKGKVADQYELGRTIEQTRTQLLDAMYSVPGEMLEKMALTTEKWMDSWIQNEGKEWLTGDINKGVTWDESKLPHAKLVLDDALNVDLDMEDEDTLLVEEEERLRMMEDNADSDDELLVDLVAKLKQ